MWEIKTLFSSTEMHQKGGFSLTSTLNEHFLDLPTICFLPNTSLQTYSADANQCMITVTRGRQ